MTRAKRIVIAANRLPVHRSGRQWVSSAGGLVTALAPILRDTAGTWVGWTGTFSGKIRPFNRDGVRIQPVSISKQEADGFYNGMANRTLWPLYHDAISTPEFRREWWKPYCAINQRFARTVSRVAGVGDIVWAHDYHLQMLPSLLRAIRPDLRIGFFLHIPFPPDELFEWLPWRESILNGLLGADLIGFQTSIAVENFTRVARQYTAAKGSRGKLMVSGRRVRVGSFPISIDTDWWSALADTPRVKQRAEEIRRRVGIKRQILLAVDRLDYTKGIVERLQTHEEMLRERRLSVDECVLIQIAVPSRENIGDYASLRDTVERMVGRINGEFGMPGRVAVHYFRRNHTREDLAAYYCAADVMLVTPLRDGMNLVAKEYIACRTNRDGVLVLSQFAGAASELSDALIVNPRDTDQVSFAIKTAMSIGDDEIRARMTALRRTLKKNDVFRWADTFLGTLRE